MAEVTVEARGNEICLPAFATAHSHAFQRAMRGLAQRPGASTEDDFWSWREAMYSLASALTPERIAAIARVAYAELRAAGVLTVGEFHYVHHAPNGRPYAHRTVIAETLIDAARASGLRICLLRAVYHRAGPGRAPEGAQARFADAELEAALRDIDALRTRYANDANVRIGIAPHSVRAVPPSWLPAIADYARTHALPVHMHIAEQPAEIAGCLAETGKRPLELVADAGLLDARFVAVHATHLAPNEATLLGNARAFACLCPTTERDLGDGLPDVTALRAAGVRLCNGIDSHVMTDPFEEMRGVEVGERLRTLHRITERKGEETPAERLWRCASHEGARALGFADAGGRVVIDRHAPTLALVDDAHLIDALVFSAGPAVVRAVEASVATPVLAPL